MKLTKKIENAHLKGSVEFTLPEHGVQLEKQEKLAVMVEEADDATLTKEFVLKKNQDLNRAYYQEAKEIITKVDLEILSGDYAGSKIQSVEDAYRIDDCRKICNSIVSEAVGGVKLSKEQ